jgi:hypothetical protein
VQRQAPRVSVIVDPDQFQNPGASLLATDVKRFHYGERSYAMQDTPGLTELIDRLPTRSDDEVAVQVIEGRALSKSETSVHLALTTGLVAVPLASIIRVTSVPGTKDIVRLVVRNPDGIRHLLRVTRTTSTAFAGPGVQRGEKIGGDILGPGVSTCDYYDTETATGEDGFDASDDEEAVCQNDDVYQ